MPVKFAQLDCSKPGLEDEDGGTDVLIDRF
jgi:hypothetical protein